jgi:transposase
MAGITLEMNTVQQIGLMYKQGLKIKVIARNLSLSKNTVKKYLREMSLIQSPQEDNDSGFESDAISNEDPQDEHKNRLEILQAYFPDYEDQLKQTGMTLLLLWEGYKRVHAEGYEYSQFCYHYQRHNVTRQAVMHFEHEYGDRLYLDFAGKKVSYVEPGTGEIIDCEFFVAVQGGSQETYARAALSQQKADFIGCVQEALFYYGGVPKVLIPDNLKSAVTKASRYDPTLNEDFLSMANHYQCTVMPARSLKPRDKSLVERHVAILYTRVYTRLHGQTFFSLHELNEAIGKCVEEHNNMFFQGKDYSRRILFDTYEKEALSPLPANRFELKDFVFATVMKNCHIQYRVDKHYYSAPYRFIGEKVKVAVGVSTVEIYRKDTRVAIHARDRRPYKYTSEKDHLPSEHQYVSDWNPDKFIQWGERIDPSVSEYIRRILDRPAYPETLYRGCSGILQFEKKIGKDRLVAACKLGLHLQSYSYTFIQGVLSRKTESIELEEDIISIELEHENIRGTAYYKSLFN